MYRNNKNKSHWKMDCFTVLILIRGLGHYHRVNECKPEVSYNYRKTLNYAICDFSRNMLVLEYIMATPSQTVSSGSTVDICLKSIRRNVTAIAIRNCAVRIKDTLKQESESFRS